MLKGMNQRRWGVGLGAVLLCLLMAGELVAQDRKGRGARSGGQLEIVESVDVANRTLTMGKTVYFVPQNADLEDAAGNSISLDQIHGVGSDTPADMVEIWTRRAGRDGRPEIRRLLIKPPMSF